MRIGIMLYPLLPVMVAVMQKSPASVFFKAGAISPRFDVPLANMEKWINNLLPSRQFGFLILTTSDGILDHEEARRRHIGGKLLGFFY